MTANKFTGKATTTKPRLYRATAGERRNGFSDDAIEAFFLDHFRGEETRFPFIQEALVRSTHRRDELTEKLARVKRDEDLDDPSIKRYVRTLEQELGEAQADVDYAVQQLEALDKAA